MTEPLPGPLARHLRRLAGSAESDAALLARFADAGDQVAFAEVVSRHGPMVLATCRRVLGHRHDAEDAAQAAFLVLAKKGAAVRWRATVGPWLHAVALRLVQKLRARQARRRAVEEAVPMPAGPAAEADWDRVQAVIDEEIRNLPAEYAAVVLLCGVESVSPATAAGRLNLSEGAVRGRLYRGRVLLRERLASRGVAVSAAVLIALLARTGVTAAPALAWDAVAAAAAYAHGLPVVGVSAAVPEFARKVLTTMFLMRTAPMALIAFVAAAATGGAVLFTRPAEAAPPAPIAAQVAPADDDKKPDAKDEFEEVEGKVKAVEAGKGVLVGTLDDEDGKKEHRFAVSSEAKVSFHGRPIAFPEAKPGMSFRMKVRRKTGLDVVEANLDWPSFKAEVKAADAGKGSVSVEIEGQNDQHFTLAIDVQKDAAVTIDGIPAAVDDLIGTTANLFWSVDKKSFVAVEADGGANDLAGAFRSADAAGVTLAVQTDGERGGRTVLLNLPVAADAKVRLLGKAAKLTDLQERMPLRVRLKADHRTIEGVWADRVPPMPKDDD